MSTEIRWHKQHWRAHSCWWTCSSQQQHNITEIAHVTQN
jgi:hypothetical protein